MAVSANPSQAARPSRLGALSEPAYRLYWFGSLAAVSGAQLALLAQGWAIVDKLDGTPLTLGILGAATAVPTIVLSLFGGVLADRMDRRRLLIWVTLIQAALLALMAVLDTTGSLRVWHINAIAVGLGLAYGIDGPARNALFPLLIRGEQMMSAVALNSMIWQGTRVVAPAVGGVLIALVGTAVVFWLSAVAVTGMYVALLMLQVPAVVSGTQRNVGRELREGLEFIFTRRLFLALIGLTYAAMLLGMQHVQLMPLMAKEFGVESGRLGLLFSAGGAGAVCGTAITLRLQRTERLGLILLGALFCSALLVTAFALTPVYGVGLGLLFFASLGSSVFAISTMTALQMRVPDHLRGRVMGIHTITFSLIPLGGLIGGAIAEVTNVRFALALSALVLVVIVVAVGATQRPVRTLSRVVDREPEAA